MKNKKLFYLVYIFSIVVLFIPTNIPVNSSNSGKHLSIPGEVVISRTILVIKVENIDTNNRYILNLNNTHNDINKYTLPPNITNFELQVEIKGNEGDVVVITLLDVMNTLFDSLTFTIMEMASLFSADIILDLFIPILIIAAFSIIFSGIMKSVFGNTANPIKMLNHKSKKDHRSALILDTFKGGGAIARMPDVGIEKTSFQDTEILEVIEPTNEIIDQCMICKLPINLTDVMVSCDECGSEFHNRHWKEWIKMRGFCPICKFKIRNVEHAESKKKKT